MRGYYPGEREYRERPQPPAAAAPAAGKPSVEAATAGRRSASRRIDRVLGILLGVVLGILVVVAFLLFGSEGTIDAPGIHGVKTGKPAKHSQSVPGAPAPAANE